MASADPTLTCRRLFPSTISGRAYASRLTAWPAGPGAATKAAGPRLSRLPLCVSIKAKFEIKFIRSGVGEWKSGGWADWRWEVGVALIGGNAVAPGLFT
jgi:hypothetical protein